MNSQSVNYCSFHKVDDSKIYLFSQGNKIMNSYLLLELFILSENRMRKSVTQEV